MLHTHNIIVPITEADFKKYYMFRWNLLRKPWAQPLGSEKDLLENESVHRMAVINNKVIAVGRLHYVDKTTAQVRYMAVDKTFEKQGIGKAIYSSLEQAAKENKCKTIILQAREKAVGFYEKQGYKIIKPSHLLFNEIQHYEMTKTLP